MSTGLDSGKLLRAAQEHLIRFQPDGCGYMNCDVCRSVGRNMVVDGNGKKSGFPMILYCPGCDERHIDKGEFATKPHHTHACQHCGMVWRPAIVPTVGVQFLPGFKDGE